MFKCLVLLFLSSSCVPGCYVVEPTTDENMHYYFRGVKQL